MQMLTAKWKSGGGGGAAASVDTLKPGQVRTFKITGIDLIQKKIELEVISAG